MVIVGLIAAVLGIIAGLLIDWFPIAASDEARQVDTLWDVLIICSVPIFVGVAVVVVYSVWKFRARPGEEGLDGPSIHGNTRLEVIWTALPAILLVGLCSYSWVVLNDIEAVAGEPAEVRVVGEQFTWTFYYERDGEEVASPDLYLEVGKQVRFTLQSKDVIHDFWVPAFRIKKDAVPGIDVHYTITPSKVGEYEIVCAELCGLGHAVMRSTVHVLEKDDYEQAIADIGKAPVTEDGGTDGKAVFTQQCGSCHALSDAGSSGAIGPNLDETLADKDEAYIRRAIVDPSADIAPGYQDGVMPPNYEQTLSSDQIDALVSYLSDVTKEG
jgi:cytochrome c oxidase subunit 2